MDLGSGSRILGLPRKFPFSCVFWAALYQCLSSVENRQFYQYVPSFRNKRKAFIIQILMRATLKWGVPNTFSLKATDLWRYLRNYFAVKYVWISNQVIKKRFTLRKIYCCKNYEHIWRFHSPKEGSFMNLRCGSHFLSRILRYVLINFLTYLLLFFGAWWWLWWQW